MQIAALLVPLVGLSVAAALVMPRLSHRHDVAPTVAPATAKFAIEQPDVLALPAEVVATLGVRTESIQAAPPPPPLRLDARLWPDTNRLTRVHTRFPGEVVELGNVEGFSEDPTAEAPQRCIRALRNGDKVTKGQLLAVVWSTALGEKKSELVTALSKLTLHRETAARFKDLDRKGATTERNLREADQIVEADEIAVAAAKQTLRTWRLSEDDIDQLVDEASRIHKHRGDSGAEVQKNWARVEIRAPQDGVIVEKNVAEGDYIESQLDMFKIADLHRLEVVAHIYQDDLRLIENRPVEQWTWKIQLKSDPQAAAVTGRFSQIGVAFDPHQQTAVVRGWVDNSDGHLRIGQFVSAEIDILPPEHAVAIATGALIDRGGQYEVFTQDDPHELRFRRRPVVPLRHGEHGLMYVRSHAPEYELQVGEQVVVSGGFEIAAELERRRSEAEVPLAASK